MKARQRAGARTEDEPTQRSRGAAPPVATGPRSCQSGRNPGGISPGFRWESHCRLLSSGGPEESGEAGWGGRREGAGGGGGGRRRRRRTRGGRRRRGRRRRRRRGAAAEPLARLGRAPLQILPELQPRRSRAPAALPPNFSCSYIPSHLIYSSKKSETEQRHREGVRGGVKPQQSNKSLREPPPAPEPQSGLGSGGANK